MTRVGHAWLTLLAGACLALGCTGSSPRDIHFGQDANADFKPPPPSEASADGIVDAGDVTGTAAAV